MRITFCLPDISKVPMGGYKIIFEYANRLAERNHDITIVFRSNKVFNRVTKSKIIKNIVGNIMIKIYPRWFNLNSRVKRIATPYDDGKTIPDADFIFATAVTTASFVKQLPERCGRKCYFVQGFETWIMPEKEVIETYNYGFLNFTISNWLYDKVKRNTKDQVVCISNPIDTKKFYVKQSIEDRNKFALCMLYHEGKHKGVEHAVEAINIVKNRYPDIVVNVFGVPKRPVFLPNYFKYTEQANETKLLNLYNRSSIFVCATIEEGFGLTGAESMACGCALVSTSYSGVLDYAIQDVNSLLSPVKNSEQLANNIIRLLEDDELRFRLARRGSEDIREMSWDNAVSKMENVLRDSK